MRDVIEHLDNTAKALAIARQLLVPGGSALVTFPRTIRPLEVISICCRQYWERCRGYI